MPDETSVPDFLPETLALFRSQKQAVERALAQVADADLDRVPGDRSTADGENSIALIVQHIAGNQRSRWTDFLTSDGEKPDRQRDTEFAERGLSRAELMDLWESGWSALFGALEPLTAADMTRTVTIRGEPHTVAKAILRQVAHYATHVGQIVQLARHFAGSEWTSLSIPRGGSGAFNASMEEKAKRDRQGS